MLIIARKPWDCLSPLLPTLQMFSLYLKQSQPFNIQLKFPLHWNLENMSNTFKKLMYVSVSLQKTFFYSKYPGKNFSTSLIYFGNQLTQNYMNAVRYEQYLSWINFSVKPRQLWFVQHKFSSFLICPLLGMQCFREPGQGFTLLWTLLPRWLGEIAVCLIVLPAYYKAPSINWDCLTPSTWKEFKEENNHRL